MERSQLIENLLTIELKYMYDNGTPLTEAYEILEQEIPELLTNALGRASVQIYQAEQGNELGE